MTSFDFFDFEEGLEKGREEGIEARIEKGMEAGIEKGREEGMEKGKEKGREKEKIAIAKVMLQKGLDIKTIIEITGLTAEIILQ